MHGETQTPGAPQAAFLDDPKRRIDELLREQREEENKEEGAARLDAARALLADMHEADIADLLERLPRDSRADVWRVTPARALGKVLLEVSPVLCEDLVERTPSETMVAILRDMSGDDVASLMRELPKGDAARLMRQAGLADNADVRASLSFTDDSVGALMDYEPVLARENDTVGVIRERLLHMGELPSHCDKLFIVDDWERLAGVLPLKRLLLNAPDKRAADIMVVQNLHTFVPDDGAEIAAGAFERYNIITAPVLDGKHKVVGRLTIDEILDYMHGRRNLDLLNSAGVSEEEDLFAPLLRRFGNRWRWLFVNLIAVFVISRIIGAFEGVIAQLVALASLMPIVAGMSGNVGNQTATLTVRAIALGQISDANWRRVVRGEALLSAVNGLVWGVMVGAFSYAIYQRLDLSVVLVAAMVLCFVFGALAGFAVPVMMRKIGRDPALGATVVVSAVTDALGFFFLLGMGGLFLL